jgi:hypothetical protein
MNCIDKDLLTFMKTLMIIFNYVAFKENNENGETRKIKIV